MDSENIKNLASEVMLQAVKDYINWRDTPERCNVVLKDLRSNWMNHFTNGMSLVVAEQLEKHPEEIAERIRQHQKNA